MGHRGNGVLTGSFLLTTGALVGTGVGLLLAPRTGKFMRKEISRYAKRTIRGAGGVVGEFSESVTGMVDAVGDRAADILTKGKDLTIGAKKEVIGAIEHGRKMLDRKRVKLEKLIE